jgi:hypothetical protein
VLTASAGSWSGSPAPSFAYQWLRCDGAGGSCSSVADTATTYTTTAADAGLTFRVAVTASNTAGSVVATSNQTAPIAAAPSAGFPTTAVLDNFNRVGPDPGASWSTLFSGESKLSLSNQQAAAPASTYAASVWNAAGFGPNVEVYATMNTDAGVNLFARITNPGSASLSGYSIEFHPNLSAIYVYRIKNGVYSGALGGSISASFARGARVGMAVIGNTITAWLDTGGGWKAVGSRTDTTFTQAGNIAAELYGGSNRGFDDFGGGTTS